jgi:hypothetical protein
MRYTIQLNLSRSHRATALYLIAVGGGGEEGRPIQMNVGGIGLNKSGATYTFISFT